MKKKYIKPHVKVIGLNDDLCLDRASVGRTGPNNGFTTDETFNIDEDGTPDGSDPDKWYDNPINWGGD